MVQILPPVPSFGEEIGRSLGGGFGQGLAQGLAGKIQQRQQLQQIQAKELAKAQARQQLYDQLFNTQQNRKPSETFSQSFAPDEQEMSSETVGEADGLPFSPEQIQMSSIYDPQISRIMQGQNKLAYQKMSEDKKLAFNETRDLRNSLNQEYKGYLGNEAIYDLMEDLNKKDLAGPLISKISDFFDIPISLLSNPSSETYDKLSQTLTRGVTQSYRGRILASEFDSFARQIPTLLNSKQGRDQILSVLRLLDLPQKLRYDAYRNITKGRKVPPIDLEERINDKVEPQIKDAARKLRKELALTGKKTPSGKILMKSPKGELGEVDPENVDIALEKHYTFQ